MKKVAIALLFGVISLVSMNAQNAYAADELVDVNNPQISECIFPIADAGKNLAKYVQQEIDYPQLAIDYGIEGNIIVEFSIEESGEINALQIIEGLGFGCDQEVVKALEKLTKNEPYIFNDFQKGSLTRLEINFALN